MPRSRRFAGAAAAAAALAALLFPGCETPNGHPRGGPEIVAGTPGDRPVAGPQIVEPAPGEEVWVIERSGIAAAGPDPAGEGVPGTGSMVARRDAREVPLPLERTDVQARIAGWVSSVAVTQTFRNPYDGKIEAVYVFPLPHDAAVRDFVIAIGERRIRGIIREREEARAIYAEARRQGYVASLLSQDRPNVFTQSIANIEPLREIAVRIEYFHAVPYRDGAYEFVFPMVVGPRFNPPGSAGGVGAAARGARGASGQRTEVEYLRPGERGGREVSLSAEIDAGAPLATVESPTHAIEKEALGEGKVRVRLARRDRIPNRDFVLRYALAGERVLPSLFVRREPGGAFFTLVLHPPAAPEAEPRRPMEFFFVLDGSGSMAGEPLAKAKEAVERLLRRLDPADTFQIIRFSDASSAMSERPLPATPEHVRRGLAHLASLQGEGGTMMIEGIRAALGASADPERPRLVTFLTDGYIGNEDEIFGEARRLLGDTRIFSFGVGKAVNRHLLEGLASLGRGAVAYVGLGADDGKEVAAFYERVRRPALAGLSIDWGGLAVSDVYPRRIPDLLAGRPVTLTGRISDGPATATIRVRGTVGGAAREIAVPFDPERAPGHEALPAIWARMRIADLSDLAAREERSEAAREAKRLALEHGLVSAWTSFVAVDALRRTGGDHGTTVPVAVPIPEGVRYDTTVPEGKGESSP